MPQKMCPRHLGIPSVTCSSSTWIFTFGGGGAAGCDAAAEAIDRVRCGAGFAAAAERERVPFSSSSLGLAQGNKIEWRRVAAVAVPVCADGGPRVGDAIVDEEVRVGAADGGEEDDRHERKDGSRDGSSMVGCGAHGYASNV
uniref:Predicted protein n=1 Tax=Hordeum vulgare subsp. vulgare TaxID=112509 RepID=F2DCZ1_HORVV|nr:predicted protein [Hordeum vulgare subsp. vulgare]